MLVHTLLVLHKLSFLVFIFRKTKNSSSQPLLDTLKSPVCYKVSGTIWRKHKYERRLAGKSFNTVILYSQTTGCWVKIRLKFNLKFLAFYTTCGGRDLLPNVLPHVLTSHKFEKVTMLKPSAKHNQRKYVQERFCNTDNINRAQELIF